MFRCVVHRSQLAIRRQNQEPVRRTTYSPPLHTEVFLKKKYNMESVASCKFLSTQQQRRGRHRQTAEPTAERCTKNGASAPSGPNNMPISSGRPKQNLRSAAPQRKPDIACSTLSDACTAPYACYIYQTSLNKLPLLRLVSLRAVALFIIVPRLSSAALTQPRSGQVPLLIGEMGWLASLHVQRDLMR
jgi:hypothetical protein